MAIIDDPSTRSGAVPTASVADTLAVTGGIMGPLVARGVIKRRRSMTNLVQRVDADRRAVQRMQGLRARYGPGPVRLQIPARDIALVLDPGDVDRVLAETPEPFASAAMEKSAALGHFEPEGALISHGPERAQRRRLNEEALDTGRQHRLADDLVAKVVEESARLVELAGRVGELGYDDFIGGWWRMVRRVVLGDGAAEDHVLTDQLAELRDAANLAFMRPPKARLREEFLSRLGAHLAAAEPGSLASTVASAPAGPDAAPVHQVPQWLFAFDAAAIATYRALALIGSHPDHRARVRAELADRDLRQPQDLPLVRATVLESLRLWPTTPAVLRETTEPTQWTTGTLDAGALVVIFAPFFHRDDERLPEANRLAPELWSSERPVGSWPLIPFSAGPAQCAGMDVVLLLTSTALGVLAQQTEPDLVAGADLHPDTPLPGSLSPFPLRFALR